MATNMTFADYVTPIPADWLNNVNTTVNNQSIKDLVQSLPLPLPVGSTASTPLVGDNSTLVATTAYVNTGFAKIGGSASQQFLVAPATSSNQAVNLSQFPAKPIYSTSQPGSPISIGAGITYNVGTLSITMPTSSKSSLFRILVQLVSQGTNTAINSENTFQNSIFDGTNTGSGSTWNVYKKNIGNWATADTFMMSNTAYNPGQVVTFTQQVTTGSGDVAFTLAGCHMTIVVFEA